MGVLKPNFRLSAKLNEAIISANVFIKYAFRLRGNDNSLIPDVGYYSLSELVETDIITDPATDHQILIDEIEAYNSDSTSHIITFYLNDRDNSSYIPFHKEIIEPGTSLHYSRSKGWSKSGGITLSLSNKKVLAGALYETFDRDLCSEVNSSVLSSGRLSLQAIWLPAGITISSISLWSATTAGASLTNQLFGLFGNNRNLLRSSVNDTSTAWSANSKKTLALTSAFTTTYSGLYYIGVMVTATTVPTLKGNTAKTDGSLNNAAPSMGGTSNTGLTTALPGTANSPGTVTTSFWACVN